MFRLDPFGDGYTEPGFIAPLEDVHEALRFSFRPALVEESQRLRIAARNREPQAYQLEAARFTAVRLLDWNWDSQAGGGARAAGRISAAALLRLPCELFARLHAIVAGWACSEVDPDWPAEARERARQLELVAQRTGRSIGQVRQERDERNLILGVNLQLFQPAMLARSCQSCQSWMYDEQHRLVLRLGQPVPRPAHSPTPCWSCPKLSPEHAAGLEDDQPRIQATLRLFFDVRASHGRCLNARQAADGLLIRHLALVDAIVRRWQARQVRSAGAARN